MKIVFFISAILSISIFQLEAQNSFILKTNSYKNYIDRFNADDNEIYKEYYPNDSAWTFLKSNIPLLDCPDKNIELTYYFRWWTYRKHVKQTPDGFIISEFLPQVPWSGKYNSISCSAANDIYEGRWLRNNKYINDFATFWFRKGGDPILYSFWVADALWANFQVKYDTSLIMELLPDLIENYKKWETGWMHESGFIGKTPDGLFSTIDDRDGMEMSIGGSGKRPTINSYMYGDAKAIASILHLKGNYILENKYIQKADSLKTLILDKLWDNNVSFFKTLPYNWAQKTTYHTELVNVREILGYTPWYFNLPPVNKGYEKAWELIKSDRGFYAPYGLTTAEQSHPEFQISYSGHECQWNGPSWPYSTAVTLTAMANVLNNYEQTVLQTSDYFNQLVIYANAHRRINEKGKVLPWIDEVLNPFTGDWLSRTILEGKNWPKDLGGIERGKDYNHSTFCDLVITGLIGLRPRSDNTVVINPLIPQNKWDWFCLDNISYHGKTLTIVFDRYGNKYNKGKGLMCFVDGVLMAQEETIGKISFLIKI